jgi:membrane fusion protein (multidrug efflux system)
MRVSGSAVRLTAVAAIVVLVSACGEQAAASNEVQPATSAPGRTINVEVMSASSAAFTEVVRITGAVQANRDVIVSAEEGGVIREVFVDKGSRVKAGDPIARVDDKVLQPQVAQAKAQADLANELWERRRRLYDTDKVGTEIGYLEAKYGAEQAKANHDVLAERLRRTVVRAPLSGVMDSRDIEVGTMVAPGTRVARIVQLDSLKVSGGVPERYAIDIRQGTPVTVRFDVLPGREFSGRVAYAGAAVNAMNRTFPIELTIANNGLAVKPEMVANIEAVRRTTAGAIALPQEALIRVEGGFIVFVVEADSAGVERAVARSVRTGPAQQNRVSIDEGINPGDRVVIVGQNQLAAGDRVRIVGGAAASSGGQ